MRALRTMDGSLIAVPQNNEQVNVAVIVRIAPGVRAIQPDLFGLEFRHQPLRGGLQQSVVERLHEFLFIIRHQRLKAGSRKGFGHFHFLHGTGTALKTFLMIASVVTACASAS